MINDQSDNRGSSRPGRGRRCGWAGLLAMGCVHLTGLAVVAALIAFASIGTGHIRWVVSAHQAFGDASFFATELAIHLLLSALVWTLLYLGAGGLLSNRKNEVRLLSRQRGTAITETIIVMPVLLLIILGVSQLAVNNLANMLLNYGTTQAARTAWVWAPEVDPLVGSPRMGVTSGQVEEMARLQVAAAMTPVAPSNFAAGRSGDSLQFEKMRATLLASQMANPPNDSGREALSDAEGMDSFETADALTFVRALDGSNYAERTVRKFSSAYMAVQLDVINSGSQVGVELTYHHQITFPLVGPIFGESSSLGGAPGYYMSIERDAYFRSQVRPNAELPRR